MAAYQAMRFGRANQALTRFCIGISIGVFGTWNYSEHGLTYRVLHNAVSRMKMLNVLPKSAQLPTPESVRLRLVKYFVQDTRDPDNYASYIGAAFSHKAPLHLAFNMIAWTNFSSCLYFLPTPHYAVLIFGSAIASSAAFQYQHRGVPAAGLGASGVVSGLASCVTMFMPMARASMFGLIPAPLFLWTLGYFFLDTYFMGSGINTGIGHSAHVGGAVFGAVYYTLFLRKWGGILSRTK